MVNVFSFCLYGPPNPKYYPDGLNENINLILKHFPAWKIFVYLGSDVDLGYIDHLRTAPNVILRFTGKTGEPNMIDRFFAIDEPGVDLMMVRDADSRVHWKDRWAIRQFLKSIFIAHTIRDNPAHNAPLMGGLWGLRKESGINVTEEYEAFGRDQPSAFGHDQGFLLHCIYPKVLPSLLVHCPTSMMHIGEHVREFPFKWTNSIYCGRVETPGFIDSAEPSTNLGFLPRSLNK
jgi:hypothetical protein